MTISFHLLWRKQLWPKAISLAKTSSQGTAFPGSLVQWVIAFCDSRPSFSLLCQFPLPEANPQFQFGDCHSLCQETGESDAFISEGMFLCRKPTPIRVKLTQVYLNLLKLRGGVAWQKDFLGYIDRGLRSQFRCSLLGFATFIKVTYIFWDLVSSFVKR